MGLRIKDKNATAALFHKEGGVIPTGTIKLSQNGTYDVTNYAFAEIETGGEDLLDARIAGTLSGTYSNSTLSIIRKYRAFNGLNIQSIYLPQCKTIGSYVFHGYSSLTSIDLPQCESINDYAFQYCYSLISVNLPNCSYIGSNAFGYCSSLTSIDLPNCSYISIYAFACCSSLTSINLPKCSYIGNYAFYNCSSLTSIYLTSTSLVSLANINAFYSTPLSKSTYTGTFGSIYVPSSLLASYKTKAN